MNADQQAFSLSNQMLALCYGVLLVHLLIAQHASSLLHTKQLTVFGAPTLYCHEADTMLCKSKAAQANLVQAESCSRCKAPVVTSMSSLLSMHSSLPLSKQNSGGGNIHGTHSNSDTLGSQAL